MYNNVMYNIRNGLLMWGMVSDKNDYILEFQREILMASLLRAVVFMRDLPWPLCNQTDGFSVPRTNERPSPLLSDYWILREIVNDM